MTWRIPADPLAQLGPATVIRGDARQLPLADSSVDLVVTSPPYFALRSYQDAGQHYGGQLGSESTPQAFVDALLECTREMMRVLKPAGSIFVNLGDKYAGSQPGATRWHTGATLEGGRGRLPELAESQASVPDVEWGMIQPKSLIGIPWRYALACIDQLGLILRAEIIWSKPNGLPESVTDRVRRSHEQWFHFVKQPRYFAAVDEIRESQAEPERSTGRVENRGTRRVDGGANQGFGLNGETPREYNPLGKLPGSVRDIPTAPLAVPPQLGVDHFAAFPPAWPAWLIRGWSPTGICTACGEGRRPVTDATYHTWSDNGPKMRAARVVEPGRKLSYASGLRAERTTVITGHVCACTPYTDHAATGERHRNGDHPSGGNAGVNINAGTRQGTLGGAPRVGPWRQHHLDAWTPPATTPAVILDPFGGTGTTAMAARALGRHGITVDLSTDYCRLARWRVQDLDELAAVRGLPRLKRAQQPGQDSLFEVTT